MICVSIANCNYENIIEMVDKYQLVELRLDKLSLTNQQIKSIIEKANSVIVTMRPEKLNDDERIKMIKYAIDCDVDYIDVEIDSADEYKTELIKYARNKNTKVIVSYHNYEKTPVRRELDEVIRWSEESEADIIKIACFVNSEKDAAVLISLYELDKKIISIGMGEKGRITRVASLMLGAPFTFAAVSDEKLTAPGQLSVEKIKYISELINNG